MLSFEFEHRGERRRLAVYRDAYAAGGNLALVMLDATDPREDGYLEEYGVLTVNPPCDPAAARWCACPGHVVVDTNNNPARLVGALEEQGVLRVAPASVRSGHCLYPLACLSAAAMDALEDAEDLEDLDTLEEVRRHLYFWAEVGTVSGHEDCDHQLIGEEMASALSADADRVGAVLARLYGRRGR